MKLVFATHNKNKLAEVQKMLPKSIELLSLNDINCFDDIEETASTLEGNANIKANFIKNNYGFDCFADDTGLEVTALNGEPGVYSARYAGEPANSEKNIQKLLLELKNKENRKAQFTTVICLIIGGKQHVFKGVCKGEILTKKQGENGFGYDPIFRPDGYDQSFAEMSSEEKNHISHRRKAIDQLVSFLTTLR